MITGPKYKICRRLGAGVFEKCQTQKFVLSEGRHTKKGDRRKSLSEYGTQLLEKQKIRLTYGLSEKQFSNYVKAAVSSKAENTSENLRMRLELRLDNVVYRLGLASTRSLARQMVSHGHLSVNGVKSNIPSQSVSVGDVVSITPKSKDTGLFSNLDKKLQDYNTPDWLSWNPTTKEGTITKVPKDSDGFLDFHAVLEFYSR